MDTNTPLIGFDWGSTSLRAYRYETTGDVGHTVTTGDGILGVAGGDHTAFETALRGVAGPWLDAAPDAPLLAAGMIGSRQGWREVPYLPTPADLTDLADRLVPVPRDGADLRIVPGVVDTGALPSVMRGEETQLIGVLTEAAWAGDDDTDSLVVLPGTHTKWVRLTGRTVNSIATTMTGEIYSLLRRRSILASTMTGEDADDDTFTAAVRLARDSGVGATSTVFSTRSLGLLDRLDPSRQAAHLSGLLIGHELLDHGRVAAPTSWTLAGSPALCARYALAARELGWPTPAIEPDAAPTGLWRLAVAAGLAPTPDLTSSTEGAPA